VQQFVGVQAAFHEDLDLTAFGHVRCQIGGGVAVRGVDDLDALQVQMGLAGSGLDFDARPDQHRHDESVLRRVQRT